MRHRLNLVATALAAVLSTLAPSAHATLITFDERPWTPGVNGEAWDTDPITTEYDALGVRIYDAFLEPAGGTQGQTVLGGPGFAIRFTGVLPKFVDLTFFGTSPPGESWVSASGADGIGYATTGGISFPNAPGEPPSETPFHPVVHASFRSTIGISGLDFGSFFSTRNPGAIDNLYFGAVPAVPEPGTLAMLAGGLGLVAVAARRRRTSSGDPA